MQRFLSVRALRWWTAGFLAFVVYGSLVPLHFESLAIDEARMRFSRALAEPIRFESRSDWAANILLFIPLGFLAMASFCADRPRQVGWIAALFVIPGCMLLSAAIEFLQLYFPPRVTSINDIAAETVGGFIGVVLWLVMGQRLLQRVRDVWTMLGRQQQSSLVLLTAYAIVLILVHAFPLDLTISPADLYHKYRDGRIRLVPFSGAGDGFWDSLAKHLKNIGFFLPFGLLLPGLPQSYWRRPEGWWRALGVGLALAGIVEFAQLFVMSRYCDASDIITGGCAVLGGWALGAAQRRGQRISGGMIFAAWLLGLMIINWEPFDFEIAGAGSRWREISLLPFADYYRGNYLHSFDEIMSKIVLFVPLGFFAVFYWKPARGKNGLQLVLAAALVLTGVLEFGQVFLPGRYASITDVLIETLGVAIGFGIGRRVFAGPRS